MDISQNMSKLIRTYKEVQGKSYAECAEELGIAVSTVKAYAAGKGRPSAYMIEHIAEKMGVDPAIFIAGDFSSSQFTVLVKLMELIGLLEKVPPDQRHKFAELLWQMVSILDGGDGDEQTAQHR